MKVNSSFFIVSLLISMMLIGNSCRKEEIHPLPPIPDYGVLLSEIPSSLVIPASDLKKSQPGSIADTIIAFELEEGFSLQITGKKHHSGEVTDPIEINNQLTR